MATDAKMGSNGQDARLNQLETMLRGEETPPMPAGDEQFTLTRLGEFFAQHGRQQQEWTREFAQHLLETERRKMQYLEQIVGKLNKM